MEKVGEKLEISGDQAAEKDYIYRLQEFIVFKTEMEIFIIQM